MALIISMAFAAISGGAGADANHSSEGAGHVDQSNMIESMRDMHQGHEHGHDFEAMAEMSTEQAERMIDLMRDIGLVLPPMDAARGRALFANKGCVVCHSVNGVGVDIGPSLNAADMSSPMNAFEFAARMWRGAAAMTAMQEMEFGGVIDLTGQDLADLVAFAHDAEEQAKLTVGDVPEQFRDRLAP
jgi:cytochrome c